MVLKQITGTIRNARDTIGDVTLGGILPPSIVSLLIWTRDTVPRGLGFASRPQHITGVVALTVVMIVASATLLTVVAIGYFLIAMPIALLRLIPAVDERWPWASDDWPFWEVKKEGFGREI